jgi:uncharacterized protein
MAAVQVERRDVAMSRLGKFSRTGAGGVRVPATISRTGCQIYGDRVEYRPDSEVFAAASLETLPAAPVTRGHPEGAVTAANWKHLSVGHVAEAEPARVKVDAYEWISTQVVISDADTQAAVERGDVVEVSAGYTCELDETPGVAPDGTRYDAVQRNIRFNHLAVLGAGEKARAGADARLRLDNQGKPMVKIVIDGVEYEKNSDAHIAAVLAAAKKDADAQMGASSALVAAEKARADKAEAERDAARQDAAKAVALASPEKLDSIVAERLKLRADASRLLPAEYAFEGKDALAIRTDAVKAKGMPVDGKSPEYISAAFDVLLSSAPAANTPASATYVAPKADAAERNGVETDAQFRARLAKPYTDSFGKDGK